jgi:hypothetical protein
MPEAFAKSFKRDYVRCSTIRDAETICPVRIQPEGGNRTARVTRGASLNCSASVEGGFVVCRFASDSPIFRQIGS